MRDSVPSARYSSVCNVLRQLRIWLIPTYRVYRLYNIVGVSIFFTGQPHKHPSHLEYAPSISPYSVERKANIRQLRKDREKS